MCVCMYGYTSRTILPGTDNVVMPKQCSSDNLFSTYYVFIKIL